MAFVPRLVFAMVAMPLLFGVARAEDAVLMSSTAPGYNAGMVVTQSDHLSIPEGASLTLLFQSGDILRLGGPFDGTIRPPKSDGPETSVARVADLFHAQGTDASVIGGTRSTGGPYRAEADDVVVDPRRSGTYCTSASTSIWIARPDMDRPEMAIRRKGMRRTLAWPQDAERIEWPSDVPIDDGVQFDIVIGGTSRSTVTFRMLPADLRSAAARIATGMIFGCQEQFDNELRRMSLSTVPPEVWITTDRGRHAKYRAGASVHLTIMSSTDGYVYCVAQGDDGGATPIFPAGATEGAQLRGSISLSLPGGRQPSVLIAGPGLRSVRCWLADRDISAELPSALVGKPVRLPDRLTEDLDGLFARVGGTRLATSMVTIETE